MAGNGVAVNAAAYQAAGGDKMLENYYANCSGDQTGWCCDCVPMSATGCVNGQCAIVYSGRCGGGQWDGGAPMSLADAGSGNSADAGFDVPTTTYDAH
jgi:hypothetical protein